MVLIQISIKKAATSVTFQINIVRSDVRNHKAKLMKSYQYFGKARQFF